MIEHANGAGCRFRARAAATVLAAAMAGTGHAASETGAAAGPDGVSGPEQIAITGIINGVADDDLRVRFGDGELTVSMAGWDWYRGETGEAPPPLSIGENVTVTGAVDADFFERRVLRAQSVYVRDRHSFFVVSPPKAGKAPWSLRPMPTAPLYGRDPVTVSLAGVVAEIAGEEFSLEVGDSRISIDLGSMTYNPLDDVGAQRVRTGDWVQVGGSLDSDFFEDRRLDATRITSIFRMDAHAM